MRDGGWRWRWTKQPAPRAPDLPGVAHVTSLEPAEWLRTSMTTFARTVASFLPGHFAAYARVMHPFVDLDEPVRWDELAGAGEPVPNDPRAAAEFALKNDLFMQARVGTLMPNAIDALVPMLRDATTTPDACYFAVWHGFSALAVPPDHEPRLRLPHREYHVFRGAIEAARTSYSAIAGRHHAANLWWPADHAWCVASEIDHAWTYVGGSRALIDAVLGDARLESIETTAASTW